MTNVGTPHDDEMRAAFTRARQDLDGQLDGVLDPLEDLVRAVTAVVGPAAPGALRDADLLAVAPAIEELLARLPALVGCGFAAAPDVVRDNSHYLLWFQKRPTGVNRLSLNLAENDPDLYDYFDMDWYVGAEQRGAPSLFGPYVDYAGADGLVLTAAVPVYVAGRFRGVVGCDLDPDRVEAGLVASMRGLPGDAVVVNADRSVLAAGSARWMPGERLPVHPDLDPDGWLAVSDLTSWTGLTFALAAPEPA